MSDSTLAREGANFNSFRNVAVRVNAPPSLVPCAATDSASREVGFFRAVVALNSNGRRSLLSRMSTPVGVS